MRLRRAIIRRPARRTYPVLIDVACRSRHHADRHCRRRPRRADGGRGRERGRAGGGSVRGEGLGGTQIPDRRQGRSEPDPQRAATGFRCALPRAHAGGCGLARRFRRRIVARVGAGIRRRHLRRQLRPGVPDGSQGRAAAARLGPQAARTRRAFPRAPSLAGLGRRPPAALRYARRRALHPRAGERARARRRELAAVGLGRRLGACAGRTRYRYRTAAPVELRFRHRLERASRRQTRRRAAETGGRALAGSRRRDARAAGRMRDHRDRHRRQRDLCDLGRSARLHPPRRRNDAVAGSGAGSRRGTPARRSGETARQT